MCVAIGNCEICRGCIASIEFILNFLQMKPLKPCWDVFFLQVVLEVSRGRHSGSFCNPKPCAELAAGAASWGLDRKHDRLAPQKVAEVSGNPRLFQGNLGW